MNKLVSVIIPTYKKADILPNAINSVLSQTYKNIEIIVVDDNSQDSPERKETENVMKQYERNDNIVYLKHEKNKNGSAARNTGFRASHGDYIMFLDDDDEFLPSKVAAQVECMNNLDESWGASYTNYIRKKDGVTVIHGAEKRQGSLLTQELMRNLFVHAGSNLMIRRSVVIEVGGFNESFQRNQDVEFLAKILMNYKLAYVDVLGLIVNIHHKPGLFDFEEITAQYVEQFSRVVKTLPQADQVLIERMINLQLLRHYITTPSKRNRALPLVLSKELPLLLVLKYGIYLMKRKFTKKAYGFEI
jgi:glycosyltransferase involved in cell wall biosynthesis